MNNRPTFWNSGGLFWTLPEKWSLKIWWLSEALWIKKSITLITGFLWAGKTTLITWILPHLPENTTIIVNDIWAINIDAGRLKSDNTVALEENCICCGAYDELVKAIEESSNEHILIEPTGIATPESLLQYFQEKWHEVSVVTVINTDNFWEQVTNELMSTTLISQIKAANILALRWDKKNKQEFQSWLEKFSIEDIPQSILPVEKWWVEILPGQESDFYEKFWQQVDEFRWQVTLNIESIVSWHFRWNTSLHEWVGISDTWLYEYITYLKNQDIQVLRAKGINGEGWFDYVLWEYKESPELWFPRFVIITDKALSQEQKNMLKFYQNKYPIMQIQWPEIPDFKKSGISIKRLVEQYWEYMKMYTQKWVLVSRLESWSDSQEESESLVRAINTLDFQLQKLWDDMKFDTPFIWIGYKKEAYDGTQKEITTLWDFRNHCAIDDPASKYICKKRFIFLNQVLKERYWIDLSVDTEDLNEATNLTDILQLSVLEELSQDEVFMKEWLWYEYFERWGKTMKWENYSS